MRDLRGWHRLRVFVSLGTRYGSSVRERLELSYVKLEFEAATKAGLERLMFLLDSIPADDLSPLCDIPVPALLW